MTRRNDKQTALSVRKEEPHGSGDLLTATQFRSILTSEIKDCDATLAALWVFNAIESIESGVFVCGCSSGDFGVDLNRWLGYLCAALLRVKKDFGVETAQEILRLPLNTVLLYPWEILGAAEYYREQGSMDGVSGTAECGGLDDNIYEYRPLSGLIDLKKYGKVGAA